MKIVSSQVNEKKTKGGTQDRRERDRDRDRDRERDRDRGTETERHAVRKKEIDGEIDR